jgi:hypothetical protein
VAVLGSRWVAEPGPHAAASPGLRRVAGRRLGWLADWNHHPFVVEVLRRGRAVPQRPGSRRVGRRAGPPVRVRTTVGRERRVDRPDRAPPHPRDSADRTEPAAAGQDDRQVPQRQRVRRKPPGPELASSAPVGSAPVQRPPVSAVPPLPPHPPDRSRTRSPRTRMPATRAPAHARRAPLDGPHEDGHRQDPDRSRPEAGPPAAAGQQLMKWSPLPATHRWGSWLRPLAAAGRRLPADDPRRTAVARPGQMGPPHWGAGHRTARPDPRLLGARPTAAADGAPDGEHPRPTADPSHSGRHPRTPASPPHPAHHWRAKPHPPPAEAPPWAPAGPPRAPDRWRAPPARRCAEPSPRSELGPPSPGVDPPPHGDRWSVNAVPLRAEAFVGSATGVAHPGVRWPLDPRPPPAELVPRAETGPQQSDGQPRADRGLPQPAEGRSDATADLRTRPLPQRSADPPRPQLPRTRPLPGAAADPPRTQQLPQAAADPPRA